MALPKLLQKLFQNGGAGDKLNPEIVPEIKKLMLGDHVLELQEDGTLKLDESFVITSAGGTMTGTIEFASQNVLAKRDVNDDDLVIFGGTSAENGAYLQVTGKDSWGGGEFWIVAKDGTGKKELNGKPDGSLTWGGAFVERVNTWGGNSGYMRYESGLQICYGDVNATRAGAVVTYPLAFKTAWVRVVLTANAGTSAESDFSTKSLSAGKLTTTGFTAYSSADEYCNWIAIGTWK